MVLLIMLEKIKHQHHKVIYKALKQFNSDFLNQNKVLFGGGTRIALELNEYRESIDIDFICPNKDSYRAVRSEVTNSSLGNLVLKDFIYRGGIRADRDAVRTVIDIDNTLIKLEFVSFADYKLTQSTEHFFSVPYLDQKSCYINKLLANADRYTEYKDILDLIVMFHYWGEIPEESWNIAAQHYSYKVIFYGLEQALSNKSNYLVKASEYSVSQEINDILMCELVPNFSKYVDEEKKKRLLLLE